MFAKRQTELLTQILGVVVCSLLISHPAGAQQVIGGYNVFPTSSVFNTRIDNLPVDKNSSKYIGALGTTRHIHPDFDTFPEDGIPFNVVTGIPPTNAVNFPVFDFSDESDPGPYPTVVADTSVTKIEGNDWSSNNGGDRHVLMVDTTNGVLYELYDARFDQFGQLQAGSGAIYNLSSNALRPNTWTSADAAGLPIMPLLVNYQEAAAGPVKHAFRMTGNGVNGYIWPARHRVNSSGTSYPPFGQRIRLKKSFNVNNAPSTACKNVLIAMQQYGIFYADIGSNWYITGCPNSNWSDNDLNFFKGIPGSSFEAVDETSLMVSPDSQIVRTAGPKVPTVPTSPKPWPTVK